MTATVVSARVSSRCAAHILHKATATVASASASAAAADFPWEHDGGAVAVVVDVSIATGRRDVPQPFTHRPCSPRPPRTYTQTTRVSRALVHRFRHQQVSSCAQPSRQRLQEKRKIQNKRRKLLLPKIRIYVVVVVNNIDIIAYYYLLIVSILTVFAR